MKTFNIQQLFRVTAVLFALLGNAVAGDQNVIEGTAMYKERIALPKGAVFEVRLEDMTLADAKAKLIGQYAIDDPSMPPIHFTIPYDPSQIDPSHTYAVRAKIIYDGTLWFTSDTVTPVLTKGNGNKADILLKNAKRKMPAKVTEKQNKSPLAAHGLQLPTTYKGDLPCADCEAVRYHLDLWDDQVFHLHREWVGKDFVKDDIGKWRIDPSTKTLELHGGTEMPLKFQIKNSRMLVQLSLDGKPIKSKLNYTLTSSGTLEPADLTLFIDGEMQYMTDAARFTECLTGRSYPVAMEGDFIKMQSDYSKAVKEPGSKLYVSFEGTITDRLSPEESQGNVRTVVINRFNNVFPEKKCEKKRPDVALINTYWRIQKIGEKTVDMAQSKREPHLLLKNDKDKQRYMATVGCNLLVGKYTQDEKSVSFSMPAATLMACPPPLAEMEKSLAKSLQESTQWKITGNTLELLDPNGVQTLQCKAVYF